MKKLASAAFLFASLAFGLDLSKLTPRGYVNDFAGVLDANAAAMIETYCGNVERATGAQFTVVLVKSLEGATVEDVSVDLYKQWGVGKKGTDEGLMLLLSIEDRKNRIEVGFGLEPIITDGQAGDVLRSVRPILRQGDYGGAIYSALQQLGERVAQSKGVTIDGQAPTRRRQGNNGIPFGAIIGLFILFMVVMSIFGGRSGGGPGGGGGGAGNILAGMLLGQMLGGGRRGGGWGGGGFGGSGGSGGGGGGWGGGGGFGGFGGGGSGGGGASGGW